MESCWVYGYCSEGLWSLGFGIWGEEGDGFVLRASFRSWFMVNGTASHQLSVVTMITDLFLFFGSSKDEL